jgi:hypothetical protein
MADVFVREIQRQPVTHLYSVTDNLTLHLPFQDGRYTTNGSLLIRSRTHEMGKPFRYDRSSQASRSGERPSLNSNGVCEG